MKYLIALACLICFSPLAHAAEVQEVVSEKGIKAWLVEEHALPLVAVKISFTGSGHAYDPTGREGRANMTAALLMEGAGELDANAFNEALENHAIRMNTGVDEDLFSVAVESLSEHKDKAFSLLGMALASPRFEDKAVARVKSQTLSLILQQEEQPGYQLHKAWLTAAYGAHPYGKPQAGTKETVGTLAVSDFKNVMQRYLTRENMLIAVVGDITPTQLKTLLDKNLAGLPEHYDPDSTFNEVTLPVESKPVHVSFDLPQTMVSFGTQGIKRADPNYMAAFVMNQILGGGGSLTSRLGTEIRVKRGLAYSVSSYLNPMARAAIWQGGFSTRSDQAETAKEILLATLKDFSEGGASDIEVEDAKRYLTGSFVLALDSNADVAGFLINMQLNHLGMDYLEKRNTLVNAVTDNEVKAMAKQLADPAKLVLVTLGKP